MCEIVLAANLSWGQCNVVTYVISNNWRRKLIQDGYDYPAFFTRSNRLVVPIQDLDDTYLFRVDQKPFGTYRKSQGLVLRLR